MPKPALSNFLSSPWSILTATLVAQVAVANLSQAYQTLAPYLRADLGFSLTTVGLINTCIYLGTMTGSIPAGWLIDRLGSRRVLIVGTALIGSVGFGMALVGQLWLMWAALLLLGLMVATATPAGSHAVAMAFPPERRGLAVGLRQAGVPLGGALAAGLLPLVAEAWSWRVASVVAAGLALGAAWLVATLYREVPVQPRTRVQQPRLREFLAQRNVVLAAFAGCTLPTGQFIMVTYLILFLFERHGVPKLQGATLLFSAQIAGTISRVFWSWLSDRLGGRRKPLLVLVVGLAALSALGLAWLPPSAPYGLKVMAVLLFSSAALGWQGLHFSLLSELSPRGWEGRTIGFGLFFTSIGTATAPPLFGRLVDLTGSYGLAWTALAGVMGVGAWVLSRVRETGKR
jgi:MFS family permease